MKKPNTFWRLIAKSLGEKSGKDNKEADKIALIRLLIFSSIFITNCFIVYGVLRTHHFPVRYYECNPPNSSSEDVKLAMQ
jgi:hypothetical protein